MSGAQVDAHALQQLGLAGTVGYLGRVMAGGVTHPQNFRFA